MKACCCTKWLELLDGLTADSDAGHRCKLAIMPGLVQGDDVPRLDKRIEEVLKRLPHNSLLVVTWDREGWPLPADYQGHDQVESFAILDQPRDPSRFLDTIGSILNEFSTPPEIRIEWDDRKLRRQLSLISSNNDRDAILAALQLMLRRLCQDCSKVTIKRIGQGFSGSLALRLTIQSPGGVNHCILKITRQEESWRVRQTFDSWPEIDQTLNRKLGAQWAPKPWKPNVPDRDISDYVICHDDLLVEAWEDIATGADAVFDFEELWLAGWQPDSAIAAMLRGTGLLDADGRVEDAVLTKVFAHLNRVWYSRATRHECRLWESGDSEPDAATTGPPYRLTKLWKDRICSEMESVPSLVSTCSAGYAADCDLVSNWCYRGVSDSTVFGSPHAVPQSRVHGDFNRNNLLLRIEDDEARPFLIDFSTFQPADRPGHMLQDFATLESQIKFGLLDCEIGSAIPAGDWNQDQFPSWENLDTVLCVPTEHFCEPDLPRWGSPAQAGIRRAARSICLIRQSAQTAYDAARKSAELPPEPEGFFREYCAALLYHTLRTIGYPGQTSPFKRLFALSSAARLIRMFTA